MSRFDPEVFLNTEVQQAMETKFTPVPVGEYPAFIDEITLREVKDSPILRVVWAIPDPELAQKLGVEKATVNDDVWLDVEENGSLQFGPNRNVRLGRLREVLGQNNPGQAWNFRMLQGAGPVIISVGERFNNQTGEGPYATVDKYRRAA